MKTVRIDAELRLKEALDEVKSTAGNWQAQLFRLSALHDIEHIHRTNSELTSLFTRLLGNKTAFVFYCSDHDIVVLGCNLADEIFHEITAYIVRRLPEDTMCMQTRPFSPTFSLSRDWGALRDICVEKERSLIARREAAERRSRCDEEATLPLEIRREMFAQGLEDREHRIRPRVLVLEDDQLSQNLMRKTLGNIVTYDSAYTAADARSAYLATAPDVVFMDIGLPDGSGQILLGELLDIDPNAYIVMLTSNHYPDAVRNTMDRGAKGFIGKPFSRTKLLEYVSQAPLGVRPVRSQAHG